ncbi:LuxR C-terminal-related transcriptional regulator [Formosa undariae]|uniref:LuxR C-terminal-related transcriptional regulator n=1 Tax=Formosa undariae TaxID=1325436 RepID=A0ABV5F106_9FLAO
MLRILIFIFFINYYFGYAQTSSEVLIDSLSLTQDKLKKIELCKTVAVELADSDWEKAVEYLDFAESEALETKQSDFNLASVYVAKAELFASKDLLDLSLDYFMKAHEIYNTLNKVVEIIKVEHYLALIYAQFNNEEKALQYFSKIYNYQIKNNDSIKMVEILNNIGTLYLKKDLDSSLSYFNKGMHIVSKLKDNRLLGYVTINLARVYGLKGDTLCANMYFAKSKALIQNSPNKGLKLFSFTSYSKYCLQEKQYDSAIYYAQKALELNSENKYSFSNQNSTSILSQAYENKGDYKSAVQYFKLYDEIRDSLNVEEKAVNLERLKLAQEYKIRSKINALEEGKKRFKLYIAGLMLIVGSLVLSILLIKYRNRNIKGQLEKEKLKIKQQDLNEHLDFKNKELIGKAITEIHRKEIYSEILKDLKSIKLKAVKKDTQQSIDLVLQRLQKDMNSDIWKEFELSFEQVHKSFFERLTINHPSLTPKDRRLCALLFLDLSTKEIAQITGQSLKTIENSRTRLRNKLELTNEKVNLSSYLNSLSVN